LLAAVITYARFVLNRFGKDQADKENKGELDAGRVQEEETCSENIVLAYGFSDSKGAYWSLRVCASFKIVA